MSNNAQHMVALERANEMRVAKSKMRDDLAGRPYFEALARLAALIDEQDRVVGAFRLAEALGACPKLGAVSSGRFVKRIGAMTGDRRVRDLTPSQRVKLVAMLRNPAAIGAYGSAAAARTLVDAVTDKQPAPARPTPIRRAAKSSPSVPPGVAGELFAAISEHHRHVASPSCTAEDFGQADERLWDAAARIMGKQIGRRKVAA